ncbi:sugar ABC transporter substrate-binding protein [Ruminiclostridium papyrosolvens]|uniref:ABC transporter substrate-binding protein n=1 Tax=Ruminiclostridium papyrosolvens C7 TaxID=1330534 RepID=U4QZN6_9FIRM|nr:sugar ABC transporter substrate-binding protein [Ruminiclostridium papyrosolvens]EPR09603.1 hypothetical protein L323_15605 [Ruminiclostridium papyrosolvens C7]
MKKLSAIILLMAMVTTMFGCSGGSGDTGTTASQTSGTDSTGKAEKKEIVWMTETTKENQEILEAFEAKTGIKVKGEYLAFNDLFESIEIKIASGSEDYDVISVDGPMVAAYANRGYILPLDKYFTDDEKGQFIDSSRDAGIWDGKFYAPAQATSAQLLWYNKALLKQAGVTIRDNDENNRLTWEEIEDMAKKTVAAVDPDKSKGISGIQFQQVSRTYQMCALANSMGGKNIGDDGYTVDGVINNDAWIKSMTWMQNLYNSGLSQKGITADEVPNYFNSGKIVFMAGGTWTAAACDTAGMKDYGWTYAPAFKGFEKNVGTGTGSWHFGVNAASKNVDAAVEFIKYMSIGEGSDKYLKWSGDMPARKSKIQELIDDKNTAGYLKVGAYEASNTAVPRALTPGYSEYSSVMDATFENIRNGSTVKDSLNSAVEQINSAMAKYKK